MAKKTFDNLKPGRQREILEVAYREFIANDYQSASLSRIIKKLNLAKGSFYRYFNSKKELYFYLIEKSTEGRFDTLEKRLQEPDMSLQKLLYINWQDKFSFEKEHPLESAFQYRVFRERNNKEVGDLEIRFKKEIIERIKFIISNYFVDEVRTDLDVDAIALFIVQAQLSMYDYLSIRFDEDLLRNAQEGRAIFSLHQEELEGIVNTFIKLLMQGISNKKGT